jgi:transposase
MQSVGRPKYKQIERKQMAWMAADVDQLIDDGHPARLIWELVGRLDLRPFEEGIRSQEGQAGSPCWAPRLLISVWLYAYQQGIASARELERRMAWEPGLRWLCGLEIINAHTLSDFRMTQQKKLDHLLGQLLAALSQEGLVDLNTAVQDGTKIQARAGRGSAHRRPTLEKKYAEAQAYMQKLEAEAQEQASGERTRQEAARQRTARERQRRLEAALEELQKREQEVSGKQKKELRVSDTEPESRLMRHTEHGGWQRSYNVQLSTETANNFILGVSVTTDQNDTHQLEPALGTIQRYTQGKPQRMIADNGYATRENVQALSQAGVELIAPFKDEDARQAHALKRQGISVEFSRSKFVQQGDGLRCPAGRELPLIGQKKHHGIPVQIFQAPANTCHTCAHQPQCCPRPAERGRRIEKPMESEAMQQYLARMESESAKTLYKLRSRIAEFPHMRIKANWRLRRFSVRGLKKVSKEALWMVLAFNFHQWIWALQKQAVSA